MATYYARNVSGNWSANTSWDSASSGGDGPAGPPVAGDTAIFDAGFTGTITLSSGAACTTLTCASGAAGTLALGSYTLTVAGDVTFVSTMTVTASTGSLLVTAAATITGGGMASFPGTLTLSNGNKTINANGTTWTGLTCSTSHTLTLASALQITTFRISATTMVFAGAYDITCTTFQVSPAGSSPSTLTLVAGQTLTVGTTLMLTGGYGTLTVKSNTASSDTFLHFNGAAADCAVAVVTFTDVNCEHAIDNWYGGTLTRTTGITNRTSADIGGGSGGVFVTTQNGIGV
jgi:hypothetical protein